MAEYRQVPRVTDRASPARRRRVSTSFQPPGSGDTTVTITLTGSARFAIKDSYGEEYFSVGSEGARFFYEAATEVNTSSTLDPPSGQNVSEYVAVDSTLGAITITLPQYSAALRTGSWISFYDVAGTAKEKVVSIDPDNTNTSYTINGSATAVSLLDTNHGSAFLFYGGATHSWVLFKSAGSRSAAVFGTTITVNESAHTVAEPERAVLVNTGASSRTITLPDAIDYKHDAVTVVKIDSGAGDVVVAAAATETINGESNVTLVGQYSAITAVSDGDDWFTLSSLSTEESNLLSVSANTAVSQPTTAVLVTTGASEIVISLPAANTSFYIGNPVYVAKIDSGAGDVVVSAAATETINGDASVSLVGQYSTIAIVSDGSNWLTLSSLPTEESSLSSVNTNTTLSQPVTTVMATTGDSQLVVSLPAANTEFYVGNPVYVKKVDSGGGYITVTPDGAETIEGGAGIELWGQYNSVVITSDGASWFVLA